MGNKAAVAPWIVFVASGRLQSVRGLKGSRTHDHKMTSCLELSDA